MPQLKDYETRAIMKQEYDRCFPSELTITILSEEEFSKVDLTDFDDIPEELFMKHIGRLASIKGLTPVKGVRKHEGTKTTDYFGIILDTRFLPFDYLKSSMILAKKFDQVVGDRLLNVAKTASSKEEFLEKFRSVFLEGIKEVSDDLSDDFKERILKESEMLKTENVDDILKRFASFDGYEEV